MCLRAAASALATAGVLNLQCARVLDGLQLEQKTTQGPNRVTGSKSQWSNRKASTPGLDVCLALVTGTGWSPLENDTAGLELCVSSRGLTISDPGIILRSSLLMPKHN